MLEISHTQEINSYAPILLALAFQCHLNEHVYFVSQDEKQHWADLRSRILQLPSEKETKICQWLVLASYIPLASIEEEELADFMALAQGRAEVEEFLRRTVLDIKEEKEISIHIPVISEVENKTSRLVQEQYEENPYPRWSAYEVQQPRTPHGFIAAKFPFFEVSRLAHLATPKILIAGCGTGRHALEVASRFANCSVTAVDLSRASLAYAVRKTKEYNIGNITYHQADILNLSQLDSHFDIIESAGVLHHMNDPMAGWRVLTKLLKRGGLMKIGLYSAKAREDITNMREELAQQNIGDSAEEIRCFRHRMLTEKEDHQHSSFVKSSNFYSLSECRDLLFHRQEHCFTLPQIANSLEELKLKFIGFEISHMPSFDTYRAMFPGEPLFADLEKCSEFEQAYPQTFAGMYQFWCYKPL